MKHDSTRNFTVLELLNEYLELVQIAPNPSEWTTLTAVSNAPRYYRFQRLQALFRAFELPPDFKGFPQGYFLDERDADSFLFLTDAVVAHLKHAGATTGDRNMEIHSQQCRFVFRRFFSLLQKVRALQRFNSGVMEASLGVHSYAIDATQTVVNNFETPALQAVISTLGRLIDPANRSFTREELVRRHDFPDVDLLDVDLDWM